MMIPLFMQKLVQAGLHAATNHPKAKLWAQVNHQDNFCLAIQSTVYDAMLDVVCNRIDAKDGTIVDWWNQESEKEFKKILLHVSKQAYTLLRK